jgi:hypothetical protein
MDWVVKEKATGNIYSILSVSYGSNGTEYVVSKGDGIIRKYKEKAFKKKFENFEADFSHIIPIMSELLKTSEAARRIIHPLARRLHPGGYFQKGVLVYFQYDGYSESSVPEDIRKEIYYGSYGNYESRMFIVLDIRDSFESSGYREWGRINIARWRGPKVPIEDYTCSYSLPICKNDFEIDAYYYLKRYDMPY